MTHHRISPSSVEIYDLCPSYQKDDSGDNSAAERGTRLHHAAETRQPDIVEDPYDREAVLECMFLEDKLRAEFPNALVQKEVKLTSSINHGTADLFLLDRESSTAVIVDFKFGQVPVSDVSTNPQLQNYFYNAMAMYPWIKKCHVYIMQPAVDSEPAHTIFTKDMIAPIMVRLQDIMRRRETNNGIEFTPADKACCYCARKATCPALTEMAMTFATKQGLDVPRIIKLGIDYPPEELAKVQAAATLIKDWAEQVKKECAQLVKDHHGSIPGFKLVERRGNLKVLDTEAFVEYCLGKGLLARDLLNCANISVKKVVELAKDNYGQNIDAMLNEMSQQGIAERGNPSMFLKKDNKSSKALDR